MLSLYKIRVDFGKSGKRAKQPAEQAKGDTPRRLASQAAGSAPFDAADPFDVALLRWAQADVVEMRALFDLEPRVLLSTKEYKKALPTFFGGPLT